MKKWTDIEQYRHVVRYVRKYQPHLTKVIYRGTVKLHGTNVGVSRVNGQYLYQSRQQYISATNDLYGFSKWFDQLLTDNVFRADIDSLFDFFEMTYTDSVITLYGEYVGKGIQSKVAISQIDKHWILFGLCADNKMVSFNQSVTLKTCNQIRNILEFPSFLVTIDFTDPASCLETLTALTLDVEARCPVGNAFGVEGIGEGIVWVPNEPSTYVNTSMIFKTKGEKHSGKNSKKRIATVNPEVLRKVADVVDYVLTEGRLQQGLEHIDSLDDRNIGQYLKWISQDIIKEESDTIEANGLTWKDVNKSITSKAKSYLLQKINEDFLRD